MAAYRWYSIGNDPRVPASTAASAGRVVILGWSRTRPAALAREGTIEAYYASSRKMAARLAKADRGFDIEWRKY